MVRLTKVVTTGLTLHANVQYCHLLPGNFNIDRSQNISRLTVHLVTAITYLRLSFLGSAYHF